MLHCSVFVHKVLKFEMNSLVLPTIDKQEQGCDKIQYLFSLKVNKSFQGLSVALPAQLSVCFYYYCFIIIFTIKKQLLCSKVNLYILYA